MEPDYLREDLKQEVILIVCGWDDDKIIGLHQRNELDFYVVRVILNQIKSNSSPFAKKFRTDHKVAFLEDALDMQREAGERTARRAKNGLTISEDHSINKLSIEEREIRESSEDIAIEEIDKLHWYNKGLIELYIQHGNFRAIQNVTGIPYPSAYKTIQKSLREIKTKVDYIKANPPKPAKSNIKYESL